MNSFLSLTDWRWQLGWSRSMWCLSRNIKPVIWVPIRWWLLLRLLLRNKSSAFSVFNLSANINPYLIKRTVRFLPSSSRDPNLTWLFKPFLICRMRSPFVFLLRGLFEWQFHSLHWTWGGKLLYLRFLECAKAPERRFSIWCHGVF